MMLFPYVNQSKMIVVMHTELRGNFGTVSSYIEGVFTCRYKYGRLDKVVVRSLCMELQRSSPLALQKCRHWNQICTEILRQSGVGKPNVSEFRKLLM